MRAGFAKLPNAVLFGDVRRPDGRSLTLSARVLYAVIVHYSSRRLGLCTAKQETLGVALGLSVRQVRSLMHELEDAGAIRIIREGRTVTNTVIPLISSERRLAAGHHRKQGSDDEDHYGRETENGDEEPHGASGESA